MTGGELLALAEREMASCLQIAFEAGPNDADASFRKFQHFRRAASEWATICLALRALATPINTVEEGGQAS